MPEYFTLDDLRDLPQMSDTVTYPDARCEAAAAWAVSIIEREVGTSFVLREHAGEVHDGGRDVIVLNSTYAVNDPAPTATVDGIAVTDALRVKAGVLRRFSAGSYYPSTWSAGVGNVEVTYSAGYSTAPPADIKEAALLLTRLHLLETDSDAAMDARTTQRTNEMGGTTTYAVAGTDRPTGYPAIDAVIVGWRDKLGVFGFA